MPTTQHALEGVLINLTGDVNDLLDAANTNPNNQLNPDDLLRVATDESSPLEDGLKRQLADVFGLVKGAEAQQLVDSIRSPSARDPKAVSLTDEHVKLISEIARIKLNLPSLHNALKEHRGILIDREIITKAYSPSISRTNFGEALAALSQRTEDPDQKDSLKRSHSVTPLVLRGLNKVNTTKRR